MKLYYGKSENDKILIKDVATSEEANVEMGKYLTEIGYDHPYYWRVWFSNNKDCSIHDFGSWSYFFFLYN